MRVVAVVQARSRSERLPGKVLLRLAGRTVLEHVLRAGRAAPVDDVVLATTDRPEDDALAAEGERFGVRVFRGSEDDVLGRFVAALEGDDAGAVVRMTADNPLQDPEVMAAVIDRFAQGDCDYASNGLERSWPRGLDCEVVSREALERSAREGRRPEDREHVTVHVRTHPEAFRLAGVRAPASESWPDLRLTLDTAQDLAVLERVFAALYDGERPIPVGRVVAWLREHPEVVALNAGVEQKPTLGRIL